MNTSIKNLQIVLNAMGANLATDGISGGHTLGAISLVEAPPWIKTAMFEIGVHEIKGIKHDTRVLEYHAVSGGYSTDEVPWCGSFINWVMLQNNFDTVDTPARAKSWLGFGAPSKVPVVGSIAVKSRKGGGHVCFVVAETNDGKLLCIGGNQNDEVNIRAYAKSDFMAFRVPYNYKDHVYSLAIANLSNTKSNREA